MSRNECSVACDREAGLGLQHAQRRKRHRHQRRLGIFRQLQNVGRTAPNSLCELLPKRRINLLEHRTRGWKGFRESLAHPDCLGALPRKSKCCRH